MSGDGSSIPFEATTFVGRSHEIAEVTRVLSTNRMVSLIGAGGIGKSRLAKVVGRTVADTYRDGVAFVDLSMVPTGRHLTLAIRDRVPGYKQAASLRDQVQDRSCLIILDSCEHLVAPLTEVIHELLSWCPEVRIVATSRVPLGVDGEFRFHVPALSVQADVDSLVPDAAELFLIRAHATVGAPLPIEQFDDVRRLCQELDGIPLAIELAAAKAASMTPAEISSRLDDRFGLLRNDVRTSKLQHRSLEAVMDWSWEQCSDSARSLWLRFAGVFAGSATLRALEAVCGADGGIAEVVDEMVAQSLLVRECQGTSVRFRMYDTIREFGLAQRGECSALDAGSDRELLRRHADFYSEVARRCGSRFFSQHQRRVVQEVRDEIANIRLAFNRYLSDLDSPEAAARVYSDLWFYWIGCGRLQEAVAWASHLADARAVPASTLWVRGWVSILTGDLNRADSELNECLTTADEEDDSAGAHIYASGLLGAVAAFRGDCNLASSLYTTAIAEARAAGLVSAEAIFLQQYGEVLAVFGETERAEQLCRKSADLCADVGDIWCTAYVLWVRALICHLRGDHPGAKEWAQRSLQGKKIGNDHLGQALAAEVLAWSLAAEGDLDTAALLEGASGAFWEAVGCPLMGFQALRAERVRCLDRLGRELGRSVLEAKLADGARTGLHRVLGHTRPAPSETAEESPSTDSPVREEGIDVFAESAPRSVSAGGAFPGWAALTAREKEIAELVAQGLTNREIAADLYIGMRTVDTHVAHILAKLGVRRRSAVAATLSRDGHRSAG